MQEGILTQKLIFQFMDQTISQDALGNLHADVFLRDQTISHIVGAKANLMVQSALSFCDVSATSAERLHELWYAIRHRTTSRPADQAVCGGILCKLDLAPILAANYEGEDRILAFWRQFDMLPLNVLWANGPRFSMPNMRWAPRSLLDPSTWGAPPFRSARQARCTDDGLCFSGVEGLVFSDISPPASNDGLIEFTFPEIPEPSGTASSNKFHAILTPNAGNSSWTALKESCQNVAILWDRKSENRDFFGGVLVSMATPYAHPKSAEQANDLGPKQSGHESLTDARINAAWLAQLTILPAGGKWDELFKSLPTRFSDTGDTVREALEVTVHAGEPIVISEEQEWCIS
jgi:hypothetical protein